MNALSNEVVVHFDMLCECVEHRVPNQMNVAHVVAVEENQILDGTPIPVNILLSQMVSHAATTAPLYSTPVLTRATINFFLLLYSRR